nr:immunoglobulin light chain junction region [Macaca mulatta]MOX44379.1 immunoglobulin light chain junction region [Macaca mulatta]MOX44428.1 immunoglobulin light chain junction region [Macaca mulatta]MOX45747.1 immunoglobulin light chain junction region [Macaca mulatta]MOX46237.1 immunoglobulin light chain junction region [Macaca mulatta]
DYYCSSYVSTYTYIF